MENKNVSSTRSIDVWEVAEDRFSTETCLKNETLFSLGNGYLGFRGNLEEGSGGIGIEGTYINGFFETEVIKYGEIAYGFAEKSQTMLNVANSKRIRIFLEDEEFSVLNGGFSSYKRVLNMKEGSLKRTLTWTSPRGRTVEIGFERIVHLGWKHLAMIRIKLTPIGADYRIRIVSSVDGNVTNLVVENDPRVGSGLQGTALVTENLEGNGTFGLIRQTTKNSNQTVVCCMEHVLETDCRHTCESFTQNSVANTVYEIESTAGKTVTLTKFIVYATSHDFSASQLEHESKNILYLALKQGYDRLKQEHTDILDDFWKKSDVVIKGDPLLQQGIRFNLFHLLQSAGTDGRTSLAAKGLTGEGYEGHYFWDTEIFAMPFFVYTNPEISRKLLEYRYSILDKSRDEARILAHPKGAKFPWRTIAGEECSAYFPAGTAQYHINADIAYMVNRYMEVTEDHDFLIKYGAEILFETARVWADIGAYIETKGNKFCINCVTGPDEYTAIVDNNCYTNLMARENLYNAVKVARWMKENSPEEYARITDKINLDENEILEWERAADNMYVPYDEKTRIYPQDDTFLGKPAWDFENTPKEKYPLLLHYHPLVIYRHQVCKQADLVLALFLLGDLFTKEEKKINYDFYEPLTTHDSSLSTCIFSVMASEIGYRQKAYDYFMETARMDLDDCKGNTKNGVHTANMGGTWMSIVNGFAGMRTYGGSLSFSPYLPEQWEGYEFKLSFKSRLIKVTVNRVTTVYELLEGNEIDIGHNWEKVRLKKGIPETRQNI